MLTVEEKKQHIKERNKRFYETNKERLKQLNRENYYKKESVKEKIINKYNKIMNKQE